MVPIEPIGPLRSSMQRSLSQPVSRISQTDTSSSASETFASPATAAPRVAHHTLIILHEHVIAVMNGVVEQPICDSRHLR